MDWLEDCCEPAKVRKKIKYREDAPNLMTTTKCPLQNITNNNTLISKINETVVDINKIVIHAYNFLKLYLLHLYDNNLEFPYIDEKFVMLLFKIIGKRKDMRGRQSGEETKNTSIKLVKFFNDEYKKCITDEDIICNTKYNFILAYEAIDVIKNIENNITEHFVDNVNRFINTTFNVKQEIEKINKKNISDEKKKEERKVFYDEIRKIKTDLLTECDELTSLKKYHVWIKQHKKHILTRANIEKGTVNYDVCVYPQEYLKASIYLNKQFALINTKNDDDKQLKLFHPVPLRTNIIPKFMTIDTASLINLCIEEDSIKYLSDIETYQKKLWNDNFLTHKREFIHNGYSFHHMIKTDGLTACILFIRVNKDYKPIKITKIMQKTSQNKRRSSIYRKY